MKRIMIMLTFIFLMGQSITIAAEYYDEDDIGINTIQSISLIEKTIRMEIAPGSPAKIVIRNGREYIKPTGYGDIIVLIYTENRDEPYKYLLHCRSEAEKNRIANIVTPPPPVDQNLINQAYYEHNYYGSTITDNQIAQAETIAKSIADSIRNNPAYKNDLQRVKAAARAVASRSAKHMSLYGSDENKYYRSPYGVLVTGNFTCAGATRTVGRILDYMGYKWTHVNENEWLHQWCVLEMDGQIGYADGNVIPEGKVGYGKYWSGLKQVEEALKAQNNE